MKLAVAALCICLLTAGCRYQELNSMSLFEYEPEDEPAVTAAKTVGNVVPWIAVAAFYTAGALAYAVTGGGERPVSGSVSSKGISYSHR
jgi:hypothetical protein